MCAFICSGRPIFGISPTAGGSSAVTRGLRSTYSRRPKLIALAGGTDDEDLDTAATRGLLEVAIRS